MKLQNPFKLQDWKHILSNIIYKLNLGSIIYNIRKILFALHIIQSKNLE